MAWVRILVDGDSLLQRWLDSTPDRPRHSAAVREELVQVLTRYFDACGTPLTVVFDGNRTEREEQELASTPDVEVLYSGSGQSAAQVLERSARRLESRGGIRLVTDDSAGPDSAPRSGTGRSTLDCASFLREVGLALEEFRRELSSLNRREESGFRSH